MINNNVYEIHNLNDDNYVEPNHIVFHFDYNIIYHAIQMKFSEQIEIIYLSVRVVG